MGARRVNSYRPNQAQYSGRFVLAYQWATLAVTVLSMFWAVFFAVQNNIGLAASQTALSVLSVLGWALARRGQLANSLLLTQLGFLLYIIWLCVMFDVPSATVPRVSHIFVLVVALVGYLNYRRQPGRAQLALIGVCSLAFIGLSSSSYALPFAQPIGDDIRIYGAWINAITATGLLAICIFQIGLERFDRKGHLLKSALWNQQFELFYQPQVDQTGRLTGAEALLRWNDPRRGYVPPAEIIPVAEETGLMGEIGHWVLETACQTLQRWSEVPETNKLALSVNVSANQFLNDDFEKAVLRLVDRYEVDPQLLKIELTENVMVANADIVAAKMHLLRAVGIGMALDDFGTGYSSLTYLRQLPLTQLKIDRSFVQDVTSNERSAALARSIITLGRDLELSVLAEGVETEEQFKFLREGGCQEFQGYHFGRPVPLSDFENTFVMAKAA